MSRLRLLNLAAARTLNAQGGPRMGSRSTTLAVGTFAIGIDAFVTTGLVAPVALDLHVSQSAAGQLVTVFAVAYAVLAPVLAALTANLSRKHVLLAALVLFVLGNVITALAPTYALVLVSRVVAAAGASMYTSNATAVAAALAEPERKGRAMATVMGGLTVATAIGVPVGSLIGGALGWRATMWMVAALGAVALVGVARAVPHVQLPMPARVRERFAPLRNRHVVAAMVTVMLLFGGFFATYTYLGPILSPATGGSSGKLSAILWVYGSMAVLGNAIGGRLADRCDPRKVRFVALAFFACVLSAAPLGREWLGGALVWVALLALCGWIQYASHLRILVELAPAATPLLMGLNASAQYLGMGVGGVIGGVALGAWGATSLGWLSAGVVLAAALLAATALRRLPAVQPQRV